MAYKLPVITSLGVSTFLAYTRGEYYVMLYNCAVELYTCSSHTELAVFLPPIKSCEKFYVDKSEARTSICISDPPQRHCTNSKMKSRHNLNMFLFILIMRKMHTIKR